MTYTDEQAQQIAKSRDLRAARLERELADAEGRLIEAQADLESERMMVRVLQKLTQDQRAKIGKLETELALEKLKSQPFFLGPPLELHP